MSPTCPLFPYFVLFPLLTLFFLLPQVALGLRVLPILPTYEVSLFHLSFWDINPCPLTLDPGCSLCSRFVPIEFGHSVDRHSLCSKRALSMDISNQLQFCWLGRTCLKSSLDTPPFFTDAYQWVRTAVNVHPAKNRLGFSTIMVLILSSLTPASLRAGMMFLNTWM